MWKVQKKQRIENVLVCMGCLLLLLLSLNRYMEEKPESYYNKARILLSEELKVLEEAKNIEETELAESYYVLDLTGTVIEEHASEYKIGQKLNITEAVQIDNSYYQENKNKVKVTFPIQKQGNVTGFAIFLLDKSQVTQKSQTEQILYVFFPIILLVLLCILLFICRTEYLNRHFVKPMEEISQSAKAIIKGNYELAVVKNYSRKVRGSVTDEFIYAFEQMRDELKAKEEKEQQLKRMEKEMISCISHDLRTPISTIKAYGEGIRDGLAEEKSVRQEYADTIIKKAEVMECMIKELLDQTNAEMNELSIQKKERYIEAYLDKIIREISILAKQKNFQFSAENHVPDMLVMMDAERITQVIYNIVENAIKYMDKPEKKIYFRTGYDKKKQVVSISIADNGPGISITDIPFVFDKFYRAEKSRSMSIPGAGLGLSICKYIVEAHGGEIFLDSKTGEGCTFTITLLV